MSINKQISIKVPIFNALDYLGLDRLQDMPVFMTWAVEAEKEIGHNSHVLPRHKKVLDICGCKAELPCNAEVLEIALLGEHDCSCNNLRDNLSGGTIVGEQSGFLIVDVGSISGGGSYGCLMYEIQGNHIVFYQNLDGKKITIQYLGMEMDDEGFPLVSENHSRAIMQYILWRYGVRSRYSANPLSAQQTQMDMAEWSRLCRNARAKDNEMSPAEMEVASQLLNNNPLSGYGLNIGMRTKAWSNY